MTKRFDRHKKDPRTKPNSRSEMGVLGGPEAAGTGIADDAVETTTDNVFQDLGLRDAETRLAKAELARAIRKHVAAQGWKQREAAEVLDLAQSDVSDLIRGKLARFSIERLNRLLGRLDLKVRIKIEPEAESPAGYAPAHNADPHEGFAPASVVRRISEREREPALAGMAWSLPFAMKPKWQAAPDLTRQRVLYAAVLRVPIQDASLLQGTGGATAAQGPFVYVRQNLAAAVPQRAIPDRHRVKGMAA